MSKVSVVQAFNNTPETVWALIGSPAAMSNWHPAIASSKVNGSSRTCVTADGAQIHETIDAHDDAGMSYQYRITESPLPLANYTSALTVRKAESGCVVEWSCDFDALAPEEQVEGMIRGLYQAGMSALKERLEA